MGVGVPPLGGERTGEEPGRGGDSGSDTGVECLKRTFLLGVLALLHMGRKIHVGPMLLTGLRVGIGLALSFGLGVTPLLGCSGQFDAGPPTNPDGLYARTSGETVRVDNVAETRKRLPEMPIAVLAEQPDMTGNILTLQDYIINGASIIPLFTSEQALQASVGAGDLGKPTWRVHRDVLAAATAPNTVYLLDPELPSEFRFTGVDLQRAFPAQPAPAAGPR